MTTEMRLPVDDEIERILAQVSAGEPFIQAELDAVWLADARRSLFGMMRAARRLLDECEEQREYCAMIQAEVERTLAPKMQSFRFLEQQIKQLAEVLLVGKAKHVDVPGAGRIQYRDHRETLRIEDDAAFISALSADERHVLVEDRPHLKRDDAKAYAAQVLGDTGQILPGVERVEAYRSSAIEFDRFTS